jgi:protease PrsW
MLSISFLTLIYAVIGGFVPALVWLFFLLKEDSRCPEPRTMIISAFGIGCLTVLLVLPIESFIRSFFSSVHPSCISSGESICLPILFSWAATEEICKYMMAAFFILWRKEVDEPIDLIVYMLTVALGFAALENTLFLIDPISKKLFLTSISTDNLRFIGSTLLHVVASTSVGFALALSFRKSTFIGGMFVLFGLSFSIVLHTLFNFFILHGSGMQTLFAFFIVWTGAVIGLALFEFLRYLQYRNIPDNVCYPKQI